MDPLLEQEAQEGVEGVVGLGEMDPGRPVAEVLQPGAAFGLGPQGLARSALYFQDSLGVTSVSHSHD